MRLIDADALIEKAHHEAKGMNEPYKDFGVLVEWLVDKTPTIEPEQPEIVMCKDCVHRINHSCDYSAMINSDDDFCSWGRKEYIDERFD